MDKSLKSRVSESRRLLKNQYAHIEYLEDFAADARSTAGAKSVDPRITASRKLLQNPYAYLDDSGGYSAVTDHVDKQSTPRRSPGAAADSTAAEVSGNAAVRLPHTDREIEALAKDLHSRLWRDRALLWKGAAPTDPIDILDPAIAFRLIGYECKIEEGFVQFQGDEGLVEVAGFINPTSKTVHISHQFSPAVQTFTAAHELGHAVMHHALGSVHRDRPKDGLTLSRDPVEMEADKFATCFLMPAKLVRARFLRVFGTEKLELNEQTAFALSCKSLHEFQVKYRTRRDLARLLAGTESYNGRYFTSLATQFRVSIGAMAIRIEELALLRI